MEYGTLVDAAGTEGAQLVAAVADRRPEDPVPTCEGWTVRDLAVHVGEFCGFWSHVLCEGTGRAKPLFPDPPDGDGLAPWVEGALGSLTDELGQTPASTEVWTWFEPDHTANFVARRAAHELAVHRFDAQSVGGGSEPIPADLAVDGVDEVFAALTTVRERSGRANGERMVLWAPDPGTGWVVTMEPDRISVQRDPGGDWAFGPDDLVVAATPSDLELILYGRPTLGLVELRGDTGILAAWQREFTF